MRQFVNQRFCDFSLFSVLLILLFCGACFSQTEVTRPAPWWSKAVEARLAEAGENRSELTLALAQVPADQRAGLLFLIENMPPQDLKSLGAAFLLENLTWAYQAMQEVPWAGRIPDEIFLNEILPYASVTESRDNWRKRLHAICLPLIKDCTTPAEAGHRLNQQLFKRLKVKYSRKRRAADQGPLETMETGLASCTGLSILLVDACRSVGVPARVVGTPLWTDRSGNHTWVEIWDGDWFFAGAAEASPQGLNHGWFVKKASLAIKEERRHAIYASSFKQTGLIFPLSFARRANYVHAVNVTDRYTAKVQAEKPIGVSLKVDVYDRPRGDRVAATVTVTDDANPAVHKTGTSKGETSDMNDHLIFQLPKQQTYVIEVKRGTQTYRQHYTTGTSDQDYLKIYLSGIPIVPAFDLPIYKSPPIIKALPAIDAAALQEALLTFFAASPDKQADWSFPHPLEKLLRDNEPAVRQVAWQAYRKAMADDALKADFDAKQVRFEEHLSPYTVKAVGTRPAQGWALFVALHGGGGTTKEFNDRQWKQMQVYYRDHPEVGGYLYVALRAPNDKWNGFYTGYTYSLFQNLLRQFLLYGDVDPNKKFVMGYSHGGYGAFAIGPKMADHFAAIHASAAAPTDGSGPKTLRNTVFTVMLGEDDTRYGRYKRVQAFAEEVQALRGERRDIYPVTVQIVADHPHSGLPDRDKIAEMYPHVRNPVPREVNWALSDSVIRDFFWLHASAPKRGMIFNATCRDNHLTVVSSDDLCEASVLLDSRLIDFNKPVTLELNGKRSTHSLEPSLRTLCQSMQRRGDPELAFTSELILPMSVPEQNELASED